MFTDGEDGMDGLMKQAQQMQEKMKKLQEELSNLEITGESGAGLIKVVMNGAYEVRRVSISPELMTEEKEVLEDLVAAAVNDAVRKLSKQQKSRMLELTGGMGLPPGLNLPQ